MLSKKRFSIREIADRWHCNVNTVIDYIEDKLLPVYAKTYIFNYETDEGKARISVLRKSATFTEKLNEVITKTNSARDNPLLPSPLTIEIGEDSQLDSDDIALLALDNFHHCFIYGADIEKFEKQYNIQNSEANVKPLVNFNQPIVLRANDYNECIAQVITDFIDANGYAPTTTVEVVNRMKNKPPLGFNLSFQDNIISINGSTPKPIHNLERAIKRLLEQKKFR